MRKKICPIILFLAMIPCPVSMAQKWRILEPGIELATLDSLPETNNKASILIVRIDPELWRLEYAGLRESDPVPGSTARQWAERYGFSAVINAGMFATDYRMHVGYTEYKGRILSKKINGYKSVAAFDPKDPSKHPTFRLFDLDSPGVSIHTLRTNFNSIVQNLRLIKHPGTNCWSLKNEKWSEAALGQDSDGNILFLFSRFPMEMAEFNRLLLSSDIRITAAHHLEGGPEAQIYVKAGDVEIELFGSYETGFRENDSNIFAWPIPNVLGISRK